MQTRSLAIEKITWNSRVKRRNFHSGQLRKNCTRFVDLHNPHSMFSELRTNITTKKNFATKICIFQTRTGAWSTHAILDKPSSSSRTWFIWFKWFRICEQSQVFFSSELPEIAWDPVLSALHRLWQSAEFIDASKTYCHLRHGLTFPSKVSLRMTSLPTSQCRNSIRH